MEFLKVSVIHQIKAKSSAYSKPERTRAAAIKKDRITSV